MSLLMSAALMGVAMIALPVSRRLTGDLFTPGSVILTTWCGALSLFLLRLLPYPELHADTAWLLAGAVLLMVGGMGAGQWLVVRYSQPRPLDAPSSPWTPLQHPDRWVIAFGLIGLAGTIWYAIIVSQLMGAAIFVTEPLKIRLAIGDGTIPSRYLFLEYFCVVAPTLALALALAGIRLGAAAWMVAILAALATWTTTDRTHFFLIVLVGYFMALFQRGKGLSPRRFAGISAVVGALLVANFLLVGAWLGKTPQNLGLKMDLPNRPPASASDKATGDDASAEGWLHQKMRGALQSSSTLYLYSTGSFAALDVLLHADRPRTNGAHIMYPFGRALERLGVVAGPMPPYIAPFLPIGLTRGPDQPYNAYTFLFYPLEDFGPPGGLVYALAVGVLSGAVYAHARGRRDSPAQLLLIGHLYGALVLTIFVNKFNNTASWYVLLASLLPFLVTRARTRPPR